MVMTDAQKQAVYRYRAAHPEKQRMANRKSEAKRRAKKKEKEEPSPPASENSSN